MGRKKKGYQQVSVGLLPEEISELDKYLAGRGLKERSEVLRAIIKDYLGSYKTIIQDEPSTGA